jgi:hypothetical protein
MEELFSTISGVMTLHNKGFAAMRLGERDEIFDLQILKIDMVCH